MRKESGYNIKGGPEPNDEGRDIPENGRDGRSDEENEIYDEGVMISSRPNQTEGSVRERVAKSRTKRKEGTARIVVRTVPVKLLHNRSRGGCERIGCQNNSS